MSNDDKKPRSPNALPPLAALDMSVANLMRNAVRRGGNSAKVQREDLFNVVIAAQRVIAAHRKPSPWKRFLSLFQKRTKG